ncbi:hypothetical protein Ddc_04574 [Ditylenchus destructor]|nr:hypothetical protein Ddc_04574 [Ditylenchus destructor]
MSNYSLSLFSFSECGRSPALSVRIATKQQAMGRQFQSKLMPVEIFLIILVLVIWALILHHFIKLYKKITFVNITPMGGYYTNRRKDSQDSKKSDSNQSAVSKSSNVNQFDLLEDAVCAWRSETVLSTKFPRDPIFPSDSRDSAISQEYNPYSRSAKTSLASVRRFSRASLGAPMMGSGGYASEPNNSHKRSVIGITPIYRPIPQVTISDDNYEPGAPTSPNTTQTPNGFHPSRSMPIIRKQSVFEGPNRIWDAKCEQSGNGQDVQPNERGVERRKSGAGQVPNFNRRMSTNPYRQSLFPVENGQPRRKISQVLLGKASNDIRRCSTFSGLDKKTVRRSRKSPFVEKRSSLRRRLSMINDSLQRRLSFKRKSWRQKVCKLSSLREDDKEGSTERDHMLNGEDQDQPCTSTQNHSRRSPIRQHTS